MPMNIKLTSRKKFLIVGLGILLVCLYPFETTVVPAWKVKVVNEAGVAYPGLRVVQYWKHYSLELTGGMNGEERHTDRDGLVHFPRRTIRMPLIGRIGLTALATVSRLFHGSTGVRSYIMATGPTGMKELVYEEDQPPPESLVLPGS
jgi:hypothetical protein